MYSSALEHGLHGKDSKQERKQSRVFIFDTEFCLWAAQAGADLASVLLDFDFSFPHLTGDCSIPIHPLPSFP